MREDDKEPIKEFCILKEKNQNRIRVITLYTENMLLKWVFSKFVD